MSDFTEVAKRYYNCGLSVIPVNSDKIPIGSWTPNSKEAFPPDDRFLDCSIIGVCCGVENIEAIDIDCKYDLTGKLFESYKKEINDSQKGLLSKLVVQKTINGGYHFIYKCSDIGGNQKLANRLVTEDEKKIKPTEKQKVLIETRGVGGYIAVYPSNGYSLVYGSIEDIQEITPQERRILFDCAKLFNEVVEPLKDDHKIKKQVSDLSPFDDFNERGDVLSIIEGDGWQKTRERGNKVYYLRPGGDGKWSAEYDFDRKLFYVWTTSTCFINEKAYNHSQVVSYLKFNQDYSETAKWLISMGYGKKELPISKNNTPKSKQIPETELGIKLRESIIDTSIVVEKPPTILSVKEKYAMQYVYKKIFSLGNFSCVIGKAKAKKTFLVTLLTASILSEKDGKFIGDIPKEKNTILYFDTEQSNYDSWVCIKRIERMAGKKANFVAYNLRKFNPTERCQLVEYAINSFGNKLGYVIIDGIADLATGINDEEEASRITTFLLQQTAIHSCHITVVLHQNKNDNFATGHLGSSIMKKSEMVISVTKVKGCRDSAEVSCDYARGTTEFETFTMRINNEGIPVVDEFEELTHTEPIDEPAHIITPNTNFYDNEPDIKGLIPDKDGNYF